MAVTPELAKASREVERLGITAACRGHNFVDALVTWSEGLCWNHIQPARFAAALSDDNTYTPHTRWVG